MGYPDLEYFRNGLRYRLYVGIEDDSGRYLDINTPAPSSDGFPDYFDALRGKVRVTVQTEGDAGIYFAKANTVQLDNRPWAGNSYGFWDAPFPVKVVRDRDYVFSTFYHRKLVLKSREFSPDGTLLRESAIGPPFLIEDVQTDSGDIARMKLVGIHKLLMERSAASVKDGSEWPQGYPIGPLINRLVKAADPDFELDPALLEGQLDLGTLDEAMASSWGPCPGVLADGTKSIYHWIPRCLGHDSANANLILVGFEVPGGQPTSGGAIGAFDVTTGRWTIYRTPDDGYPLDQMYPITIWAYDSTNVIADCIKEKTPTNHAGFYEKRTILFPRDGSSIYDMGQAARGYWPARWSLRQGGALGSYSMYAGHILSGSTYVGENMPAPFPQMIDFLEDYILGGDISGYAQWNTYRVEGAVDIMAMPETPAQTTRTGFYGGLTIIDSGDPNPSTAAFRFWMTDTFHAPVLMGDGNVGGSKWFYWIEDDGQDWRIRRQIVSGNTYSDRGYWRMDNMYDGVTPGGSHLYHRQITAYAFDGDISDTSRQMLIAVVEWDDTEGVGTTYSRAVLWRATFDGGYGTQATFDLLWSETPVSVNEPGWTIVGLWTPPRTASDFYHGTGRYVMAVMFSRADVRGTPYTVGIFDAQTGAWHAKPTYGIAYGGPQSSKAFAGFVMDLNLGRCYFVDQATGQCWSVNPSLLDWRLENKALPVHSSDHHVATTTGFWKLSSGANYRYWGMAPGPHGDVTMPYWERDASQPASARYNEGLYPLVQLSKKVADAVDVAEFRDLKVWAAIKMLRQLAYDYTILIDDDATIKFQKREAGSPIGTLKFRGTHGYVAVETDELPFERYQKRILYGEIKNAIDVTPHELRLNPQRDPEVLRGAGSVFGGSFVVAVDTDRPLRLQIRCTAGGDMYQNTSDTAKQKAILWRYARVLESLQSYLAVGALGLQTFVRLGTFAVRGDRYYCGEQQVRVGDSLQVQDGPTRTIDALEVIGQTEVKITLNGQIGDNPSDYFPRYALVTITPQESASASDSDEGVTEVAVAITGGPPNTTTIKVKDASALRADMVLQIDDELFLVTGIEGVDVNGDWIVAVERSKWGDRNDHVIDTPVLAYVCTLEAGKLYPVGDTGVRFGVEVEIDPTETDPDVINQRSVSPGDGVIVTTEGYSLKPVEHAVQRAEDKVSIDLYRRKDLAIGDNRFLDLVKGYVLSAQILAGWSEPRLGLFGVRLPWWPGAKAGYTIACDERRISEAAVNFEIFKIVYDFDFGNWMMDLSLRSFSAVAGAGEKTGPAGEVGFVIRGGKKRHAEQG